MADIKPGKRYFSVVYEITNPEAFQATAEFVTGQRANEAVSRGAKVTACGWGDYSTERSAYFKEIVMTSGIPHDVLVGYIHDEHPDRITREEAEKIAEDVSPD